MEALMSKRHRKSKDMLAAFGDSDSSMAGFDADMYEAPRGKKPKGKQKRQSLKRAYYDD